MPEAKAFTVRYPDDAILAEFDRLAQAQGSNRNEQICELITNFVRTQGDLYYIVKAFTEDGRAITIEYANGHVYPQTEGVWNEVECVRIDHAVELCRRGGSSDLEKAMDILRKLVGEGGDVMKLDSREL